MPFNQKEKEQPIDDELLFDAPPSYNTVLDTPELIYAEENECLKEENQFLRKEITNLKESNGQLQQTNSLLEEQVNLIKEQLELSNESKLHLSANLAGFKEHTLQLQTKSARLIDWLAILAAEEERTLAYVESLEALLYAEALESCTVSMRDNPEITSLRHKMQELEISLQEQKGEISTEIERQVNEKTQGVLELFDKLLDGEVFAKLVSNLEAKFTTIIRQEQEVFYTELAGRIPAQNELIQQYLDGKTKKLAEIKQIHSDEKSSLFYNTSYIVLWAKIIGVVSLFSQLVEKKAGTGEKFLDLSSSIVGGLLGSVPVVGSLLDTVASFTIKEVGGAVLGHFEDKKTQNILEILKNPDYAKKMAELFARSLTQRYQSEIQAWDAETIKSAATKYSNQVYELSIGGKIRDCQDESTESKVETFLGALKEISPKEISLDKDFSRLSPPASASPKPKFNHSEKSAKTIVHEGTQTLRKKLSETEFLTKHTKVHLQGIKRQNSGLQQESAQHQKQIIELESKVSSLEEKTKQQEEEMKMLQKQILSLQEMMANWMVLPPEVVPVATTKKSTTKETTKDKFRIFSKKEQDTGAGKFYGSHTSPITTK